jgi:Flp pilus assembly protein TadD
VAKNLIKNFLPVVLAAAAGAHAQNPAEGTVVAPTSPLRPSPVVSITVPDGTGARVGTSLVAQLTAEGLTSFQSGDFSASRGAFVRVLELEPDNVPALVNLGASEFRLGQLEESERHLRRSLVLKNDNATAWLNLAIVLLQRDQAMAALAAAAQAAALKPNDAMAHHYLGLSASRLGWLETAETELRRAIELQPDYAEAHFNLAVFCLGRRPPAIELARRHYHKALEFGMAPDPIFEKTLK